MSSIVTIGGGTTGVSLKVADAGATASATGTALLELISISPQITRGEKDVTHLGSGDWADFIPLLGRGTVNITGHLLPDKINLTTAPLFTRALAGTISAWALVLNDPTTPATIDWQGFITDFNPDIGGPEDELMISYTVRMTTKPTLTGFATT
jgi:hypothetical protein